MADLANIFAGIAGATLQSPAVRGYAETDSEDGTVEVYFGQLEPVYETEEVPVYLMDEDGMPVLDENDEPVPMTESDGRIVTEEVPVLDEDGEPVAVFDADGNPVYRKVQLTDPDGEPIAVYNADGTPVAQTDPDTGEPVYKLDDEGEPLPVLDENGEQVYDYSSGEAVPLYQVEPVVETQVATVEAIGAVKAGETPLVSMGHGGAAAIAGAGWGDSIEESIGDAAAVASEAAAVAAATNQHFWSDTYGIHVTEAEQPSISGHNILINSLGILLRTASRVLVSITRSAIAFFDGEGSSEGNIVAQFGKDGAVLGKVAEPHVRVTADGVAFLDGAGTREANIASIIGAEESRIGRARNVHTDTDDSGFVIRNGSETWFSASGEMKYPHRDDYSDCMRDIDTGEPIRVDTLDIDGIGGTVRPYRIYARFTPAEMAEHGGDLVSVVNAGLIEGDLDPTLLKTPQPDWVWAVNPPGEPEPDVWIGPTDGEISDLYVRMQDAAYTAKFTANACAYEGNGGRGYIPAGSGGPDFSFWLERRWTGDIGTMLNFQSKKYEVIIASVYDVRDGEIDALVPLKQNGVQVSVEGHRHGVSDIDGLEAGLVTGVKGSAEDEYRTGDVDIGEEDIGVLILGNAEINDIWNAAV